MSFEKMYDLVVSTGEYKDGFGKTKKKWLTIGAMFEGDKGPFVVLEPHINLAGLPRGAKGSVLVSCFEPSGGGRKERSNNDSSKGSGSSGSDFSDYDDDIPF